MILSPSSNRVIDELRTFINTDLDRITRRAATRSSTRMILGAVNSRQLKWPAPAVEVINHVEGPEAREQAVVHKIH